MLTVASAAPPGSQPRCPGLSLCSYTESLPRFHARLWCGLNGARVFAPLDWEVGQGSSCQCKALCALVVSKPACGHSSRVEPRLLQPSVCPSGFLSRQGGLSPLLRTPGLVCPDCGSTCLLPRARVHLCGPSLPYRGPSRGLSSQPDAFFFFSVPAWLRGAVSCCLGSSASFQLVFPENCSTCRSNFELFIGRGELHIFLLHLLDPRQPWHP